MVDLQTVQVGTRPSVEAIFVVPPSLPNFTLPNEPTIRWA